MICKRCSTLPIQDNLLSWPSTKQVSANGLSSKENQSSQIRTGLAAKSAKVVCYRYTIIEADLGSSRWIRLRDVSLSKEKETYQSKVNIVIAWSISKMNSCFSSNTEVPIVTLSLRTNGKSCPELNLGISRLHARLDCLHARLETRSTC